MTYDPDAILANPDAHPVHKRYAAINIGLNASPCGSATRPSSARAAKPATATTAPIGQASSIPTTTRSP